MCHERCAWILVTAAGNRIDQMEGNERPGAFAGDMRIRRRGRAIRRTAGRDQILAGACGFRLHARLRVSYWDTLRRRVYPFASGVPGTPADRERDPEKARPGPDPSGTRFPKRSGSNKKLERDGAWKKAIPLLLTAGGQQQFPESSKFVHMM